MYFFRNFVFVSNGEVMNAAEVQRLCLKWNIPFYAYRLPGEKDVFWGAQLNGDVLPFREMSDVGEKRGFVMVPFRETADCPALFIRSELSFVNESEDDGVADVLWSHRREAKAVDAPLTAVGQEEYCRQLLDLIAALKRQTVSKLVLSRNILVDCDALQMAPDWFTKLTEAYPEAFVFLVSVPGVTTWMGATPEVFLRQEEGRAETMALAGTRPVGTKGVWGEKEIEEQQIVDRYVEGVLNGKGEWRREGPFSKQAGQVEHLCTSFVHNGVLSFSRIDRIRQELHPTPAVGGVPVREAVGLLERTERHGRRYYAGYLGPVGPGAVFHWFVNLRSMELFARQACLFVGGGITALSEPEKEWRETEMKSRTLLDVMA